jgi:ribonuclease D
VDAARATPHKAAELAALKVFSGPRQRRQLNRWYGAVEAALSLPDTELPPITGAGTGDGIPPSARWRERDPVAAERLVRCRAVVAALAEEHSVLAQNLLASDAVRRLAWQPPDPIDVGGVRARLTDAGARGWQVDLTAAPLTAALVVDATG